MAHAYRALTLAALTIICACSTATVGAAPATDDGTSDTTPPSSSPRLAESSAPHGRPTRTEEPPLFAWVRSSGGFLSPKLTIGASTGARAVVRVVEP